MRSRPDFDHFTFGRRRSSAHHTIPEEDDSLLSDDELDNQDGDIYPPHTGSTFAQGYIPHADLPVFETIHRSGRQLLSPQGDHAKDVLGYDEMLLLASVRSGTISRRSGTVSGDLETSY